MARLPCRVLLVLLASGTLLAGLGVGPASPSMAAGSEARPIEGDPFRAEIVSIDAKWQITFDAGGKPRPLPAAEVLSWGDCREPDRGSLVILVDGSLLVADLSSASREKLAVESALFGSISFPLELLAGVLVQTPADPLQRDLLVDRIAAAAGNSDRIVLANRDEIAGSITTIQGGKVRVETAVGPLAVDLARVQAVVYNPALAKRKRPTGLWAWMGFSDGSRLAATAVTGGGKSLQVKLSEGLIWNTATKELVFLQPLGGRVTYLSALEAKHLHVPYLDLSWPYRIDRNVCGGMLRAAGRLWLQGIGVHSAARLSYALAGQYRSFQAELAIDDQTQGRGSVGFRVYVDGQLKYASPIVRGGSTPIPVRVDVSGAKQLDLVVDFADRADELDYADWLDARLVR